MITQNRLVTMKLHLLLLLCLPLNLFAHIDTGGIEFVKNKSWEEIKATAKRENKYIFIDCYATWCKPCKVMNDSVFTLPKVGDYFNKKFISVQFQMDVTRKDNEDIIKSYADARSINEKYKIKAYPTFLFFAPDGKLISRVEGSYPSDNFINIAEEAINYSNLVKDYQLGNRDTSFLKKLCLAAVKINDTAICSPATREYVKQISNIFTKANLIFLAIVTKNSSDIGFSLYNRNRHKIDRILGEEQYMAIRVLSNIVYKEEIKPSLEKQIDWQRIKDKVVKKYPLYGEEIVLFSHLADEIKKGKDSKTFCNNVMAYMNRYSHYRTKDADFLNLTAYYTFLLCKGKDILEAALKWAEQSVTIVEESWNLDTYACLLYITGDISRAVYFETKAIELDPSNDEFRRKLEKMKKKETLDPLEYVPISN